VPTQSSERLLLKSVLGAALAGAGVGAILKGLPIPLLTDVSANLLMGAGSVLFSVFHRAYDRGWRAVLEPLYSRAEMILRAWNLEYALSRAWITRERFVELADQLVQDAVLRAPPNPSKLLPPVHPDGL
jgi:hypothetical protein